MHPVDSNPRGNLVASFQLAGSRLMDGKSFLTGTQSSTVRSETKSDLRVLKTADRKTRQKTG